MALSLKEQIHELIKKNRNVLIVLPHDPSTDAITAGLACFSALEKLGKQSKIVCNDFSLPPNHQFLPKSKEILSDLTSIKKFVITVDVAQTKVEELSYDIQDDKLRIYLTPKNGTFRERDVAFSSTNFEYDLIVVLDAPDLEALGKLYEENTEFFYHTPIINIDHKPTNEHFGQVNLVELTATSSSEIVFELVKGWGDNVLDEYIATNLLAGIISKTKSFQTNSVTPRSLAIASHLISSGARREEIVRHLYQTKTLEILRLWGRTLAKLKTLKEHRIVWSMLTREDFTKSGTFDEESLLSVIDELIINSPEADIVMILYEKDPGKIRGIVTTPPNLDALTIFKAFHPVGTKDFTRISLDVSDLLSAERTVLETMKNFLREHPPASPTFTR